MSSHHTLFPEYLPLTSSPLPFHQGQLSSLDQILGFVAFDQLLFLYYILLFPIYERNYSVYVPLLLIYFTQQNTLASSTSCHLVVLDFIFAYSQEVFHCV